MTVAELKTKIHTEFEIPTNVQRWIIGKNLADHDEATLVELHAVDGSPVFLYLVAPGKFDSFDWIWFLSKQKSIPVFFILKFFIQNVNMKIYFLNNYKYIYIINYEMKYFYAIFI